MVIGDSICAESGTRSTNTSSSCWSYGFSSTVSVICGKISLTINTLSFSSISPGKGSYNLNIAEYGESSNVSLSVFTLVVSNKLSSPKCKYVFKSRLLLILYVIFTLVNVLNADRFSS